MLFRERQTPAGTGPSGRAREASRERERERETERKQTHEAKRQCATMYTYTYAHEISIDADAREKEKAHAVGRRKRGNSRARIYIYVCARCVERTSQGLDGTPFLLYTYESRLEDSAHAERIYISRALNSGRKYINSLLCICTCAHSVYTYSCAYICIHRHGNRTYLIYSNIIK